MNINIYLSGLIISHLLNFLDSAYTFKPHSFCFSLTKDLACYILKQILEIVCVFFEKVCKKNNFFLRAFKTVEAPTKTFKLIYYFCTLVSYVNFNLKLKIKCLF